MMSHNLVFDLSEWCRMRDIDYILRRNEKTVMADTLVTSLKRLAREKQGLRHRGQAVAKTERRLVEDLGHLLPTIGYRLVPLSGVKLAGTMGDGSRRVKRLRCPKCDRRFAHPLPMARHLSATHGAKKAARKASKKPVKKAG